MGPDSPDPDDIDGNLNSWTRGSESGHPGAGFVYFGTENFPNPIFKKETRFLVKSLGGYTFSKPDFPELGHTPFPNPIFTTHV